MKGESPTLRSNDSRSIKLGGDAMLKILEGIIQKILSAKDTPSHLSKMLVTSVFTKSDSCKPGNYAAIALLSILGEVFDRIVLEKIREKSERFTINM